MKVLIEKEAEEFLENNGLKVVKREFIKQKRELLKIKLKFPWFMKVSSKKIIHKRKAGGVIGNIKSMQEAEKIFCKFKMMKGFNGIIVQETLKGQELILGLKNTPEFGLVVMAGAGGSKVEELKDVSFKVTPITKNDAKQMLKEIKIKTINKPKIINNLLGLSSIAEKHTEIQELDINPLIINKKKAIIADARIILS